MLTQEQRKKIEDLKRDLNRIDTAPPMIFADFEWARDQIRQLRAVSGGLLELLTELTQ